MSALPRMTIGPCHPLADLPGVGLWQVMFDGFEGSSHFEDSEHPLPRGWRGSVDEVLEQVVYVMTNHDLARGMSPTQNEDLQARIARYREFWNRYCDFHEVERERDRLKAENERLREALAVTAGA